MKTIKFFSPLELNINEEPLEYRSLIDDALEEDNADLAEYADAHSGDSYYKKLRSCKIQTEEIDGVLYGVAVCEVYDDWNDTDTAQMKEYLEGQYADGWGEGFEQHEIDEYEEEYPIYDEDEDGNEIEDVETETVGVCCSFWSMDGNWFIKTEDEMKQFSENK